MPCNTPERFSLRLGSKHCMWEKTIAYVLFKCYIFSSSGFYLSLYWTTGHEVWSNIYFSILYGALCWGNISGVDICAYHIYIYTNLLLIKYFLKACLSLSGTDLDRSHEH